MKCEQPLFEDGQTYSIYDCVLDLRHAGAHEDARGRKYPRALALGLDEDLNDLITEGHNVGHNLSDLDDREYPVIVETVTRYVLWVSAPSEDDALAYYGADPTDISLTGETAIDGSIEVQRMDHLDVHEAFASRHRGQKIGPQIQCPDCRKLSFTREAYHDPYRRCHGQIEWRQWPTGRGASRVFDARPMPARKAVTA
ncbi:hypothetical protein ACF082_34600 [Streptomyces lydicus]|uniref:hypothetical protein n=1 Tax=Streptomyces lydicus TaxID=47763 RepID=UPI0036FCE6AE